MMKEDENTKEFDFSRALNSKCSERSLELVSIEAPVLFNKIAMRQSVTRNIALIPETSVFRPLFKLEKATDFKITKINVFPNTNEEPKKLDLMITLEYDLVFTDGTNRIRQPDYALFHLIIDEINYPDSKIKYFEKNQNNTELEASNKSKMSIKVEALAEAIDDVICSCTGALILEIGVFFMINCECITQITVPAYKVNDIYLKPNIP